MLDLEKFNSNLPIILSFAGWAQKPSSLNYVLSSFSSSHQIIHFDYSQFSSIEDCFLALKNLNIKPQIIAGWSLGGQIAARLVGAKIFDPKLLILFSTPFQFVKSPRIAAAMPKTSFDAFRENFVKNSAQTLEKFSLLMMIGDAKRAKELADNLFLTPENYNNLVFWLDELKRFSCFDLNFDNFPKTLIIQGVGDMIVNVSQAEVFDKKITNSTLKILANCGHCPHISNLLEVKNFIQPHFINLENDR
ncbi:MAG: pimeloyl-ACP methyl ester carboxylesterase [Rickettsiales bacterium]